MTRAAWAGTLACALLLVVGLLGCAAEDAGPDEPASGAESGATEPGGVETPAEVAEDQQFSFGDVAQFPDGLLIEMAGTLATKAQAKDKGAEATNGEMVVVSIVIENNTDAPYDAGSVVVGASYGDGVLATKITDATNELQSGFSGTIGLEEELVATLGFAVPFDALESVTYVVDPVDGEHEPVSFTGPVERG